MEKIIKEQVAGRQPDEIYELSIDNCPEAQLSGLTDAYTNLETLSLMNNGLTSLKGFPNFPNLRKLDLSDNQISEGLELLSGCENLEFLILSGNPLKDVASLESLKKLKQLQSLEVMNCPLTDTKDYRKEIFTLLEEVLFVDGLDRDGHPAPNDDDDDEDDEESEGGDEGDSDEAGDDHEEGEGEDGGSDDEKEESGRGTKRKHDEEDEDA